MRIYGADFSGAKSPNLYYAVGELSDSSLTILDVKQLDDRLDLFESIVESRAAWGLDFPFALTGQVYERAGVGSWEKLLDTAANMERREFSLLMDNLAGDGFERPCGERSFYCRHTDVQVNAYSGLKRYNPNLRAMMYGGLKLLHYLRRHGVSVYPFDELRAKSARAYEIYPSYLWRQIGLRRSTDLQKFAKNYNAAGLLQLGIDEQFEMPDQDAADSVVACVLLATALVKTRVEDDWQVCPNSITSVEWDHRHDEGIILRY